MADNSVKIESMGQSKSLVSFEMSDKLIDRVEEQINEVTKDGDNSKVDFSSFINNALLMYLESKEWAEVKEELTKKMYRVTYFDYSKDKSFAELMSEEQLEWQLGWLKAQKHIEVDKVEEL